MSATGTRSAIKPCTSDARPCPAHSRRAAGRRPLCGGHTSGKARPVPNSLQQIQHGRRSQVQHRHQRAYPPVRLPHAGRAPPASPRPRTPGHTRATQSHAARDGMEGPRESGLKTTFLFFPLPTHLPRWGWGQSSPGMRAWCRAVARITMARYWTRTFSTLPFSSLLCPPPVFAVLPRCQPVCAYSRRDGGRRARVQGRLHRVLQERASV